MNKNGEYDIVIAKIPKRDKKGNDITGDKLGGGGRHREDGTISGMAYDFRILDEDELVSMDRPDPQQPLSVKEYIIALSIEKILKPLIDYTFEKLENKAEIFLETRAIPALKNSTREMVAKISPTLAGIKDGILGKEPKISRILEDKSSDCDVKIINITATENINSEEEKQIIINMRAYALLLAAEIQKYAKLMTAKQKNKSNLDFNQEEFKLLMEKNTLDGIKMLLENKERFYLDEVSVKTLTAFYDDVVPVYNKLES